LKVAAPYEGGELGATHAESLRLVGRDEPVLLAKGGFESVEEGAGGLGHDHIIADFVTPRGVAKSVAIILVMLLHGMWCGSMTRTVDSP
jgi:hypothetical protein